MAQGSKVGPADAERDFLRILLAHQRCRGQRESPVGKRALAEIWTVAAVPVPVSADGRYGARNSKVSECFPVSFFLGGNLSFRRLVRYSISEMTKWKRRMRLETAWQTGIEYIGSTIQLALEYVPFSRWSPGKSESYLAMGWTIKWLV